MDKQTGPKGFLVVLPSEIIEIPQDSDKSWLTLFYSLPRELAEKWKPAYELPRCPYAVLRTDKYDHIVCDDMFKLLVWDCYAWCAWQFFQAKRPHGQLTRYSRQLESVRRILPPVAAVVQHDPLHPHEVRAERAWLISEKSLANRELWR